MYGPSAIDTGSRNELFLDRVLIFASCHSLPLSLPNRRILAPIATNVLSRKTRLKTRQDRCNHLVIAFQKPSGRERAARLI